MNEPSARNLATRVADVEVAVLSESDIGGAVEVVFAFPGLPFAAHHHEDTSGIAELQDGMGSAIGNPEIAVAIDLQAVGGFEEAFAHCADDFAVAVEFDNRVVAPVKDVDLLLWSDGDAGGFL